VITSVYIAAPYPARREAIRLMEALNASGFEVTSSWLVADDELTDEFARKDLNDIDRADALVALNPESWANLGTGGRHVEFGYALAKGKPLVIVGARTNIFHQLSDVTVVANEPELILVLRGSPVTDFPTCPETGEDVDDCDCVTVLDYDEDDAADEQRKCEQEERD